MRVQCNATAALPPLGRAAARSPPDALPLTPACSGARLLGCPVALPLASGSGARPQGRPPPWPPPPRRPHGRAAARSPVPSTPTTKRATASLDLLDLVKQKPVSLDTTHSLPLPATLAAAALSYSRGELVVRCIL